ncbi:formate dehydrogenase accessory sulfurtransferase FdhD [Paracoccus saliphilus]|uniref:Sulfur carrier protein FdhD n=1 Tax=Paracoccus saliphilus TaxID=405559 RepID=A0ABY7S6L5_9RHOB|nr:formate dehydrogenase accessory sulfurtransferase FdhD [Paracoccus saliphilus]WCR02701.1 formate dehydrogenase accessory sulfurtransferase FdhD [Paracoccus saliphilus]
MNEFPICSATFTDAGRAPRVLPEETAVAITVNGSTYAVLMATPASLEDLAIGFARTEGIVDTIGDIEQVEIVACEDGLEARLWISKDRADAMAARRRAMAGPVGCGLCGIESLKEAMRSVPRMSGSGALISETLASRATTLLRHQQRLHMRSGSMHAAGFLSPKKGIVAVREDVGRHNALDKLVGCVENMGCAPESGAFVLTSRVSVELVQKAAMVVCGMIIAVSGPTALAIRVAHEAGITVLGFARNGTYECYCHPYRISQG